MGDEIIATGQARKLSERTGLSVVIVDARGKARWHPVWENNPRISTDMYQQHVKLINGPHCRPYILQQTRAMFRWKDYAPPVGEIYLSEREKNFARAYRDCVLIEPNIKGTCSSDNKAWSWDRWQELVNREPSIDWIQSGPANAKTLDGVTRVITEDFRLALAVLSVCKAVVTVEGGLHHAAAALGVPAVVLWSHYISPASTGYQSQTNLRFASGACGQRNPCPECRKSMERITVEHVIDALQNELHKEGNANERMEGTISPAT